MEIDSVTAQDKYSTRQGDYEYEDDEMGVGMQV